MRIHRVWLLGLAVAIFPTGCGQGIKPTGAETPARDEGGARYLLGEEPPGAMTVLAARKECKDGDDVVVMGRIGGEVKPWIEGRAGFWIVDGSLKSCDQNNESCPTPWDYCHMPKEELRPNLATVKVVDEQGRTVPVDARKLLGVKELQTVVVKGRAKRDDQGNLTILTTGLYMRP
jgi:hypothetical protein